MKLKKIQNYMVPSPQSVGEETSLATAMKRMREFHIRHLPVHSEGRVVGVLSDRDVKLALSVLPAAEHLQVGDVMTEPAYAVSPSALMTDVLSEMAAHKYGCAVVTDADGAATGIFTASDAVALLSEVLSGGKS